jgi:hypothetical protein
MDLTISRRDVILRNSQRSQDASQDDSESFIDEYDTRNRNNEPILETLASSSASAYIIMFLLVIFFVTASPTRQVITASDNIYQDQDVAMNISVLGVLSLTPSSQAGHNTTTTTTTTEPTQIKLENDHLSLASQSQGQLTSFSNELPTILAVSALFGERVKSSILAAIVMIESDACDPFEFEKPKLNILHSLGNFQGLKLGWTPSHSANDADAPVAHGYPEIYNVPFLGLVRRGNCPFDVKALNAKNAGLAGTIIYNTPLTTSGSSFIDIPVRMSTSFLSQHQLMETHAAFVTHSDATALLSKCNLNESGHDELPPSRSTLSSTSRKVIFVSYSPYPWPKAWAQDAEEFYKNYKHAMDVSSSSSSSPSRKYAKDAADHHLQFLYPQDPRNSKSDPQRNNININGNNNDNVKNNDVPRRYQRTHPFYDPAGKSVTHLIVLFIRSLLFAATFITFCGALCTSFCLIFTILYAQWTRDTGSSPYAAHALTPYGGGGGNGSFGAGGQRLPDRESARGVYEDHHPSQKSMMGEMLSTITLPIRIITEEDLKMLTAIEDEKMKGVDEGGMGACKKLPAVGEEVEAGFIIPLTYDCCAICIDEFTVGSHVRELPCHHVFHHTWYGFLFLFYFIFIFFLCRGSVFCAFFL